MSDTHPPSIPLSQERKDAHAWTTKERSCVRCFDRSVHAHDRSVQKANATGDLCTSNSPSDTDEDKRRMERDDQMELICVIMMGALFLICLVCGLFN